MPWKVGELAKRTGLTVRTLHHYDSIALVQPTLRTESGHRLYTEADVARLQQVISLRQLGFALDKIHSLLEQPDHSPVQVVRMHLDGMRQRVAAQQRLCMRLEAIAGRLESNGRVSVEELLDAIEETEMVDQVSKHYTPEQLEELSKRAEALGEEGMRKAETDWAELIAEVRAAMADGFEPTSEPVLGMARRWMALIEAFTGGNPGIRESLERMYQEEPNIAADRGFPFDPALHEYIGRAMQAVQSS